MNVKTKMKSTRPKTTRPNLNKNRLSQVKLFSDADYCNNPSCNYCNPIRSIINLETDDENSEISSKPSTFEKINTLKLILEEANDRFLNNYPNFKGQNNPKPAA